MIQLGLFQFGLGMMSALIFGVLNRVLIKELGVPATIATIILALSLFVAPFRVWFGQLSDTKPLWGLHRTGYVRLGAISFAAIALLAVQVMWQVGSHLSNSGWSVATYLWTGLLAILFALYGIAISASSTPFTTLLVDITDEDQRSKVVGVDWFMLILGTSMGGITVAVMLRRLANNAPLEQVQAAINTIFLIVPLAVVVMAFVATWKIERKYSRFSQRVGTLTETPESAEEVTLGRAWKILNSNRQTRFFFTFLICMTMGLFLQDAVLEPYGGEVFKMALGATALLTSFWGGGTLIGIVVAGFLLAPKFGKKLTAQLGCQAVVLSLVLVIAAGFTGNPKVLQWVLLIFGLASGVTTTGAVTLMLDLTAAETAGTFIGAWGLSQALARGFSTVIGGTALDVGKKLLGSPLFSYSVVFALQAVAMVAAIAFLQRVNVQEFQMSSTQAIAAVMEQDRD
jgi:MFS transporter, BCD family, chlorophyll transporter